MLLLLILILGTTFSFSQNDCLQTDGSFRYEAKLYLENIPTDFDKASFLNYIDAVDVVSTNDLATLTAQITEVNRTFPSEPSLNRITIVATTEIYLLLDSLNNSVEYQNCVGGECEPWTDGTSKYTAVLNMQVVPNDFDKDEFLDYITNLDNISTTDLSTLQASITLVYKTYPTAQTPLLKRIITIESTTEIFSTLANLNNSFEYFYCQPEPIPLTVYERSKDRKSVIFPNPITENSIVKLDSEYKDVRVEIVNSLGQIIYQKSILDNSEFQLKDAPLANGIYFLEIYDELNGTKEVLKMIK